MRALAGESPRKPPGQFAPFRDGGADEARKPRQSTLDDVDRGIAGCRQAAALVGYVELKRLAQDHGGAAGRLASRAGKGQRRTFGQKQSAVAAFGVARQPEAIVVSCDVV